MSDFVVGHASFSPASAQSVGLGVCESCHAPLRLIRSTGDLMVIGCLNAACGESAPKPTTGSGNFSIGGTLWPGLSKLIEEAGEVIQVAGKLVGSEGRTDHWSGDLRQMFVEELGDLQAAMTFFMRHNDLDPSDVAERAARKLQQFETWHRENLK